MGLGWSRLAAELQCLKFSHSIIAAAMLINFDAISLPVAQKQQQQQQQQEPPQMFSDVTTLADASVPEQSIAPELSVDMARTNTTDSLCGAVGMFRFDSTGSNIDPNFNFAVPTSSADVSLPPYPFGNAASVPVSFSTSAPSAFTTPFQPKRFHDSMIKLKKKIIMKCKNRKYGKMRMFNADIKSKL